LNRNPSVAPNYNGENFAANASTWSGLQAEGFGGLSLRGAPPTFPARAAREFFRRRQ
jgi:hypothetical protein